MGDQGDEMDGLLTRIECWELSYMNLKKYAIKVNAPIPKLCSRTDIYKVLHKHDLMTGPLPTFWRDKLERKQVLPSVIESPKEGMSKLSSWPPPNDNDRQPPKQMHRRRSSTREKLQMWEGKMAKRKKEREKDDEAAEYLRERRNSMKDWERIRRMSSEADALEAARIAEETAEAERKRQEELENIRRIQEEDRLKQEEEEARIAEEARKRREESRRFFEEKKRKEEEEKKRLAEMERLRQEERLRIQREAEEKYQQMQMELEKKRQLELEEIEKERIRQEKLEQEKRDKMQREREKLEQEKLAREEKERLEQERIDRAEKELLRQQQAERDRIERERKIILEQERAEAERHEKIRLETAEWKRQERIDVARSLVEVPDSMDLGDELWEEYKRLREAGEKAEDVDLSNYRSHLATFCEKLEKRMEPTTQQYKKLLKNLENTQKEYDARKAHIEQVQQANVEFEHSQAELKDVLLDRATISELKAMRRPVTLMRQVVALAILISRTDKVTEDLTVWNTCRRCLFRDGLYTIKHRDMVKDHVLEASNLLKKHSVTEQKCARASKLALSLYHLIASAIKLYMESELEGTHSLKKMMDHFIDYEREQTAKINGFRMQIDEMQGLYDRWTSYYSKMEHHLREVDLCLQNQDVSLPEELGGGDLTMLIE